MITLNLENPHSKEEILESLEDVSKKVKDFYTALPLDLFFHDHLGGWSPAQNLSHITFIASLAVPLLYLPRFLFLPFGRQAQQRDYTTLQRDYLGSKKPIYIGPLAPASIQPPTNGKDIVRNLSVEWIKVSRDLGNAILPIPEEDLDTYSLPHPSMGMLSLREMLYVLIIHPIHHTYKVEQKLPSSYKPI